MHDDLGRLRRCDVVIGVCDERPPCGVFLPSGALVLAWEHWVHFFPVPRTGESMFWDSVDDVTLLKRSADGRAVLCGTRDGTLYGLRQAGDTIESERLACAPDEGSPSSSGSYRATLGDGVVRVFIDGRARDFALPDHRDSVVGGWVGDLVILSSARSTDVLDVQCARLARLFDGFTPFIAAAEDGVTVVVARAGYAVIGEVDPDHLDWQGVFATVWAP